MPRKIFLQKLNNFLWYLRVSNANESFHYFCQLWFMFVFIFVTKFGEELLLFCKIWMKFYFLRYLCKVSFPMHYLSPGYLWFPSMIPLMEFCYSKIFAGVRRCVTLVPNRIWEWSLMHWVFVVWCGLWVGNWFSNKRVQDENRSTLWII